MINVCHSRPGELLEDVVPVLNRIDSCALCLGSCSHHSKLGGGAFAEGARTTSNFLQNVRNSKKNVVVFGGFSMYSIGVLIVIGLFYIVSVLSIFVVVRIVVWAVYQ